MSRFGKGLTWHLLPWMCVAGLAPIALKYSSAPYFWIFLSCTAGVIFYAVIKPATRAAWVNLAAVFLSFAIAEYYISRTGHDGFVKRRIDKGTVGQVYIPHKDLGWAPEPGASLRHKRFFEGEVLFDVQYSIEPKGLRTSSPRTGTDRPPEQCILFFGGSFTFGQGLEDHQTLPFLVAKYSNYNYKTYNFGVMGYGAHQMLSAMESDLVKETVDCDPKQVTHVIYQGIPDHVRRAAVCFMLHNTRGPRYRLTPAGALETVGYYEDYCQYDSYLDLLKNQINKSYIIQIITRNTFFQQYRPDIIQLYLAIIEQAKGISMSWYPVAQFHVLWWDEDTVNNELVVDGLEGKGIDVRLMSEILPSYEPDSPNRIYRQHRYDDHPNALAVDLIAQYVLREILG